MLGLKRSSLPAIVRWRAQIWSVRTLAPSSPERIWILLVAGCLAIKHHLPVVRDVALPIRIREVGTVWLTDWSQLLVVWEIFQIDTYNEYPLPETAATILDLGANAGLASRYFRSRYPRARIIAVEPDPATARLAQRNLRSFDVEVIEAAVAVHAGSVMLHRVPGQSWAASTAADGGAATAVSAVELDSLIEQMGSVSILKIDIEGAEHDVLAHSERLAEVGFIIGELHPMPGASADELFDRLRSLQFEIATTSMTDGDGTFAASREVGDREPVDGER
jgi:FkbM family methyltransferase